MISRQTVLKSGRTGVMRTEWQGPCPWGVAKMFYDKKIMVYQISWEPSLQMKRNEDSKTIIFSRFGMWNDRFRFRLLSFHRMFDSAKNPA